MEKKVKVSRLAKIPAWALSFIIFVVSIIISFSFGEEVTLPDSSIHGIIGLIFFIVLTPVACFFICRTHPKSVWYTPFICNIVSLLGTIMGVFYWTTLLEYLVYAGGLVLSILVAIVGAKIGRRKINQAE